MGRKIRGCLYSSEARRTMQGTGKRCKGLLQRREKLAGLSWIVESSVDISKWRIVGSRGRKGRNENLRAKKPVRRTYHAKRLELVRDPSRRQHVGALGRRMTWREWPADTSTAISVLWKVCVWNSLFSPWKHTLTWLLVAVWHQFMLPGAKSHKKNVAPGWMAAYRAPLSSSHPIPKLLMEELILPLALCVCMRVCVCRRCLLVRAEGRSRLVDRGSKSEEASQRY